MTHAPPPIPSPLRATGAQNLKWVLITILLLSAGIVYAMAGTEQVTAYGVQSRASSSPISPMPPPLITGVDPSQGVNSNVVRINIYGHYFKRDGRVYLRYSQDQTAPGSATSQPVVYVASQYVNTGHIVAKIPARVKGQPLLPGYYDVGIEYTDRKPVLKKAYRVFDPQSVSDLYAEPYHISTSPTTLWVNEPVDIHIKVQRLGGAGATAPSTVRFYLNHYDPAKPDENLLQPNADAFLPSISPGGSANSQVLTWTPSQQGDVKIIAVIDANEDVAESNEENNVVSTIRQVKRKAASDTHPPVISNLRVNDGADRVNERDVQLQATLEDGPDPDNPAAPVSGPNQVYYVELHWYNGVGDGTGSWIPVNWTRWLPYGASTPNAFTLHPTPGLRYLQAWGADRALNISNDPALRRLTYIPDSTGGDELAAGEIRVYRQEVEAGQCLRVRVEPAAATMDPDLYVWPPDWQAGNQAFFSYNGAGEVDEVEIQPALAGTYQIEVEGFTDAAYRIDIEVTNGCSLMRSPGSRVATAKTPRTTPSMPIDAAPTLENAPAPPELLQYLAFITQAIQQRSASRDGIYLPMLAK